MSGNVYLVEMNCDIWIVETPEMCLDFDGQYEFSFVFLVVVSFWQKNVLFSTWNKKVMDFWSLDLVEM